jgi:hypothetical protein
VKKAITKIIFGMISLDVFDPEGQAQEVTVGSHQLTEGIDGLVATGSTDGSRYSATVTKTTNSKRDPSREGGVSLDLSTEAGLLETVLLGQGSSRAAVVEVPGIEPGSSGGSSGLLRAQSATSLLDPIGHANKPM